MCKKEENKIQETYSNAVDPFLSALLADLYGVVGWSTVSVLCWYSTKA